MSAVRIQPAEQAVALDCCPDDVKTGLELETSCFPVTGLDDSLGLNKDALNWGDYRDVLLCMLKWEALPWLVAYLACCKNPQLSNDGKKAKPISFEKKKKIDLWDESKELPMVNKYMSHYSIGLK